jgi:hypothetical protein
VKYRVSLLRENGRRVGEASARKVDGYVTVEVTPSSKKDGLSRRIGMVWADEPLPGGKVARQLVAPLFDASILSIDSKGVLTLRGIELGSGRDDAKGVQVVSEHHQVWKCRPLDGTRMRAQKAASVSADPADTVGWPVVTQG